MARDDRQAVKRMFKGMRTVSQGLATYYSILILDKTTSLQLPL